MRERKIMVMMMMMIMIMTVVDDDDEEKLVEKGKIQHRGDKQLKKMLYRLFFFASFEREEKISAISKTRKIT